MIRLKSALRGGYKIIIIYEPLKVIADLTEFKLEIEKLLELGEKKIAVNFSDASYLYSGAISVLITCYRMIREKGGSLCIIEPQERVLELLNQMNIDSLIDIFGSEEEMLKHDESTAGKKKRVSADRV
jgi:anti-sigma B factor antagonist